MQLWASYSHSLGFSELTRVTGLFCLSGSKAAGPDELLESLSTPVSPPNCVPPTPTAPAACPGLVKASASTPACTPCAYSYIQGYQCLEQKDWELAVLFFSRALHLDPELVRARVWMGTGSLWHTLPPHCLSHLSGPSFQGHQVPAGN